MARIETYRCDVCAALKAEANHWWRINAADDKAALVQPIDGTVTINPREIAIFHLCGWDCALKKLSEVLK